MDFRHEWKHEINYSDMVVLRQRLKAVMKPDENAVDGKYFIRSLYFDNISDKALREKIDGVNCREKFRIRYYNGDTSLIHLEKKSKINGLGNKQSAVLSAEEAQKIVDGSLDWMADCDRPLVQELYSKMKSQGLRPKTIVDYTREPFVFSAGNVRVTLDYDIRTGLYCTDFLNPHCITIPAGNVPIILEVKWDEFLPSVIRDIVQLESRRTAAFSKYAVCRIYG
ncbi:MAG: polyphosphate polymerase domain-containing protein [Ruminococcus sp.]|nr:polyphosphate polymerase domain-containing protein [Ruminococcus sp.]